MKLQIRRVRLVHPAVVGSSAMPLEHIGYDTQLDGASVALSFDKDARFIRMDIVGRGYFELLPLSNVASIMVEPVKD